MSSSYRVPAPTPTGGDSGVTFSQLTRRRFLSTSTAAASSLLAPRMHRRLIAGEIAVAECPSTDHFWYRRQSLGPYIVSQRDNKAFGFTEKSILLSDDNGRTWPHVSSFPEAQRITFSCILKNGNVLFATEAELYLSTDDLKTYRRVTVRDREGGGLYSAPPQSPRLSRLVLPSAGRSTHLGC